MDKVSKNDVSEGINNILDAVAKYLEGKVQVQQEMYQMILSVLRKSDPQLWFAISLKLNNI